MAQGFHPAFCSPALGPRHRCVRVGRGARRGQGQVRLGAGEGEVTWPLVLPTRHQITRVADLLPAGLKYCFGFFFFVLLFAVTPGVKTALRARALPSLRGVALSNECPSLSFIA